MFDHYKMHLMNIVRENIKLVYLIAACIMMTILRWKFTESIYYLFLIWNLILAIIPYLITKVILSSKRIRSNVFLLFIAISLWLVTFPNAPYIITDLLHIKGGSSMPGWFDLILVLSYAWTALLIGIISLNNIENILRSHFKNVMVNILVFSFLVLTSFGVYIGRYLRWNSWDIIRYPYQLINDIFVRILNPMEHLDTWFLTFVFAVFLNMVYWSLSDNFISDYKYKHQ